MRSYAHLFGRCVPLPTSTATLHCALRCNTTTATVPSSAPLTEEHAASQSDLYYRYTVAQLLHHAYGDRDATRLSPSLMNSAKRQMLADVATTTSPPCKPLLRPAVHAPTPVGETAAPSATIESRVAQGQSSRPSSETESTHFIHTLVRYMRQEEVVERLGGQRSPAARLKAAQWRRERQDVRLSPMEQHVILHKACTLVEQRAVSLVTATRLLRVRWPRHLLQGHGAAQQRFLVQSALAWITQALQPSSEPTLSPRDAWAVLDHCAYHLKGMPASIVGALATLALRDAALRVDAEALVTLLWSVHTVGCTAPEQFWTDVVGCLVALNRTVVVAPTTTTGSVVGHTFSGLTTRQLYRLLAVLQRARWDGELQTRYEMADQALRNIAFEAETAELSLTATAALTRRGLTRRLQRVADLNPDEFVDLLKIAGELRVSFHVSAQRVADLLLAPMVCYLDPEQTLTLLQAMRQTQCHSTSLLQSLATRLLRRGAFAPFALPLAKSLVKTALRESVLMAELLAGSQRVLVFFLELCELSTGKVRAQELLSTAELLYRLARHVAVDSALGQRIRAVVDGACLQMERLLQLEVVPVEVASRLLEYTIVLGMRGDAARYVGVTRLLRTRGIAAAAQSSPSAVPLPSSLTVHDPERVTAPAAVVRAETATIAETDLPRVAKAAVSVYRELLYMFERMSVVRASVSTKDRELFAETFAKVGLYNVFFGALLLKQGHFTHDAVTPQVTLRGEGEPNAEETQGRADDSGADATAPGRQSLPSVLPVWMEQCVCKTVMHKIDQAALSAASSDDAVLHVLGQVHCDADKVHRMLYMVVHSPLQMVKQHRGLWVYLQELARRFGTSADQSWTAEQVAKAVY